MKTAWVVEITNKRDQVVQAWYFSTEEKMKQSLSQIDKDMDKCLGLVCDCYIVYVDAYHLNEDKDAL